MQTFMWPLLFPSLEGNTGQMARENAMIDYLSLLKEENNSKVVAQDKNNQNSQLHIV